MNDMNDKIVITGMQVWDSIGTDVALNFQTILKEKTRLPQSLTNHNIGWPRDVINDQYHGFILAENLELNTQIKKYRDKELNSEIIKASLYVATRAVEQAGLIDNKHRIGGFSTSLFAASDVNARLVDGFKKGRARCHPEDHFYQNSEFLISMISKYYNLNGLTSAISATCSSGLVGIEIGSALIKQGLLDQVIIICADLPTDPFSIYRMNSVRALSKLNVSKPFDTTRDGIVMGDGVAAFVIESEQVAIRRGAKILAKIEGSGAAHSNMHPTNPSMMTDAYYLAFKSAMETSGLSPDNIDWISAHATSTPDGDKVEAQIMSELLPGRSITSFKGHIGHTMAASSAIELIYTIEAMKNKIIPHIANTTEIDIDSKLDIVLKNTPNQSKYVIKNSYGFAGRANSIIISI
jgi:3-oxoacyl-(acyl-carrier-protein) synthase